MPWPSKTRAASSVLLGVKVNASATTARVHGRILASCGAQDVSKLVALRRDGSFRSSYSVGRGISAARITLQGALSGPAGEITATARLTRRPNRRVVRCSTGAQNLRVSTARGVGSTAAAPAASAIYGGVVAQSTRGLARAIAVRVDRTGRKVALAFAYRLDCTPPAGDEELFDFTPTVTVRANRTFATKERFTIPYNNASERYLVRTRGRFTSGGVSGTVSVTVRGRFNRRARTPGAYRCSTGTMRFSARR